VKGHDRQRVEIRRYRRENELDYTLEINSGIFAAALECHAICGMYVVLDHVDTFVGNYYGRELGHDDSVGFQTFGLEDYGFPE
jgi:hypothetical protein